MYMAHARARLDRVQRFDYDPRQSRNVCLLWLSSGYLAIYLAIHLDLAIHIWLWLSGYPHVALALALDSVVLPLLLLLLLLLLHLLYT